MVNGMPDYSGPGIAAVKYAAQYVLLRSRHYYAAYCKFTGFITRGKFAKIIQKVLFSRDHAKLLIVLLVKMLSRILPTI